MDIFNYIMETTTDITTTDAPKNAAEALVDKTTWHNVVEAIITWCLTTGVKILIALLIMFISFKIINHVTKKISKRLAKKDADVTLSKVLVNALRISLKILVLFCLIGYVGIETASVSAIIASVGVGIGLAIQGTLSNFAGGVIIVIMRPFRIGDFIVAQDQMGTVEDIKLFYTIIITPDNRVTYIPNGALANGVIVNNSLKETRRVEVIMPVSYSTDIARVKQICNNVMNEYDLVLKDKQIFVEVSNYGDSSIEIKTRCWVKNQDYWTAYFYLLSEFKNRFDENHIQIPFNQLDVHVTNEK